MAKKKLIREAVICPCCCGKGIDKETHLVCDNCDGATHLETGKIWIIEDYIEDELIPIIKEIKNG